MYHLYDGSDLADLEGRLTCLWFQLRGSNVSPVRRWRFGRFGRQVDMFVVSAEGKQCITCTTVAIWPIWKAG